MNEKPVCVCVTQKQQSKKHNVCLTNFRILLILLILFILFISFYFICASITIGNKKACSLSCIILRDRLKLYWNIVNLLKILIPVVYFIFPQNKLGLHTFPYLLSIF